MKKVFIAGSLAYDVLMDFAGAFGDHILPDSLDSLSVSFLAEDRRRVFGGCGGNIAYGLSFFEFSPMLYSHAGDDFDEYSRHLLDKGVNIDGVVVDERTQTAAAFILSDVNRNQIAMFSPGAMASDLKFGRLPEEIDFAILSPLLPAKMLEAANALKCKGVRYLLDPGQALVSLDATQLAELVDGAMGLMLNRYEMQLFERKIGRNIASFGDALDFVVVTLGADGSEAHVKGRVLRVPAVKGLSVLDTTGCGDSFRSGFIASFLNSSELEDALKWGNTVASFCVESSSAQGYRFNAQEFLARLRGNYPS